MRTLRRSLPLRGLALAALVFELVLAFAHVHSGRLHVGRLHVGRLDVSHRSSPARPAEAVALACRTMFAPGPERGCPPLRQSHKDECPICTAVAQAGTGVLPAPPAVPGVALVRVCLAPEVAPRLLRAAALAPFQARAPPHFGV